MSDFRFSEIVQNVMKLNGLNSNYRALCSSCGTYSTVNKDEFEFSAIVEDSTLEYVVKMRAWNCCNENNEPIDGFPEQPDKHKLMGE